MTVEIIPVTDKALLRRFTRVPSRIHEGDKNWIPPLEFERLSTFSPKDNEFMRRAEVRFWIAHRDGRDVGCISAQFDPIAQTPVNTKNGPVGHFGNLCAIDDPAVFQALFEVAEDFLRGRGVKHVQGPFTLSVNEETGMLIDGLDTPPMLMMGHDPAYTAARVEGLGYGKEKDLYAYLLNMLAPLSRTAHTMLNRNLASVVKMRRLDFKDYENEIRRVVDIFNDAWSDNWGFVPMTNDETDEMAKRLRLLLSEDLVWFAEIDGQAVAFIIVLPNINEAIRDLKGSLFPFGWAKLLWRLKVKGVKSGRVPLFGVRRAVAATYLGHALSLQLIGAVWPHTVKAGLHKLELSWILEDNMPMRRILEKLGGVSYKTYRVYRKMLG